jgi:hypothetical protein
VFLQRFRCNEPLTWRRILKWRRIRRGGGYDVEEDTTWRRIRRGGGYDVEEDPLKTAPLQTR